MPNPELRTLTLDWDVFQKKKKKNLLFSFDKYVICKRERNDNTDKLENLLVSFARYLFCKQKERNTDRGYGGLGVTTLFDVSQFGLIKLKL